MKIMQRMKKYAAMLLLSIILAVISVGVSPCKALVGASANNAVIVNVDKLQLMRGDEVTFSVSVKAKNVTAIYVYAEEYDEAIFEFSAYQWKVGNWQTEMQESMAVVFDDLSQLNEEVLTFSYKVKEDAVVFPETMFNIQIILDINYEKEMPVDRAFYFSIEKCIHKYDNECDENCNLCDEVRTDAHNFKTTYKKDTNNHWLECVNCNQTKGLVAHNYKHDCDVSCNICGYKREAPHQFETKYSYNENNHWYECVNCNEIKEESAHDYANACDDDCDSCGYAREVGGHTFLHACDMDCEECGATRTVEHDFGVKSNNEQHWYECANCKTTKDQSTHDYAHDCDEDCEVCGNKREVVHQFDENTYKKDDEGHWSACLNIECSAMANFAEHTYKTDVDDVIIYICLICQYNKEHRHNYNTEFESDYEQHWYECVECGKQQNKSAHIYDNECDTDCNICDKNREIRHNYKKGIRFDVDKHWYECSICGEEKDVNAHSGGEATCVKKAVCTVCKQAYGELDEDNHTGKTVKRDIPPTCTQEGVDDNIHCKGCKVLLEDGECVDEIPHEVTEWTIITKPTMETTGEKQGECISCGLEVVVEVGKLISGVLEGEDHLISLETIDAEIPENVVLEAIEMTGELSEEEQEEIDIAIENLDLDASNVLAVFDLRLMEINESENDEEIGASKYTLDGKVKITLVISEEIANNTALELVHILDNGEAEIIEYTIDTNQTIIFETDAFSYYTFVETATIESEDSDVLDDSENNDSIEESTGDSTEESTEESTEDSVKNDSIEDSVEESEEDNITAESREEEIQKEPTKNGWGIVVAIIIILLGLGVATFFIVKKKQVVLQVINKIIDKMKGFFAKYFTKK